MQQQQCEPEINSGLLYDPNFQQSASGAFSTNEYLVQRDSNVYYITLSEPDYILYSPSAQTNKENVKLYFWQRATFYWDVQCEWDGTMTREQAAGYYA